jgi:glycyl-tRNA synthetase beta chain
VEPEEKALAEQMQHLARISSEHLKDGAYREALTCLAVLQGPVDAFFDGVMVNAEDSALRHNRLNLLHTLQNLFLQVADISQLAARAL